MSIIELDDDHPLWLVNEQIKGLLEGDGASEDHENVLNFLRSTGLPDDTVCRMHKSLVHGDSKIATIESLKKNITECTAAFLRLKEVVRANHEFRLRSDPSASGDFSKGFYKGSGACVMNEDSLTLPNDATALNELIAERTEELNERYNNALNRICNFEDMVRELRQQNAELTAEVERKMSAGEFLIQQNAELTNWKQQAITVLNEIDLQEIGKVLGVGLGESVGPHILPAIKKLTAELEDWWREAHDEACTNMEDCTSFGGTKQCFRPRPSTLKGQSK